MKKLLAMDFIAADSLLAFLRDQPVGQPPRFLQPLFSVPMPPPMSRYQLPAPSFGSMAVLFQSRSSRALVPLLSPRDTKGALAPAIALNAATAS